MRGSHPTACSEYGPEGTPNPKAVGESEVNLVNKFRKSCAAEVCSGSGQVALL